jgi:hypothetical protein
MMLKYARQDEGRNDQCTRAWMGVQFISRALSRERVDASRFQSP